MTVIGYARVSTSDQSLALQINALQAAGCDEIHQDLGVSGATLERPGLAAALAPLGKGDMLVVWRLDRLGRSLLHLVGLVNNLAAKGAEFRSLTENIDTSSAGGKLIFHIMAALAEFERGLISERTKAGMHAAQLSGCHVGRPHALSPESRRAAINAIRQNGEPIELVAQRFNVHPRTLRRVMQEDSPSTTG